MEAFSSLARRLISVLPSFNRSSRVARVITLGCGALINFGGVAFASSKLGSTEPQRIRNHGDGTETHRGARDDWTEQHAEQRIKRSSRNRDAERIVDESEEEILPDIPHHLPAQMNGF